MSDAMEEFCVSPPCSHEHKPICVKAGCAKRSNVEALDAKRMTNSLSLSTKHHQFVSRFSEFGLRDFVARPKPMLGWS